MHTAWFITTNTEYSYPGASQDPWFSRYSKDLGPFNPQPSSGATGYPMIIKEGINHGYATIKKGFDDNKSFSYYGERPSRWLEAEDLWFHGFWQKAWADLHIKSESIDNENRTIHLSRKPGYPVTSEAYFYAENLLEEITQPGEWYLNRTTGILYFWPTSDIDNSEIIVSMLEEPLVKLNSSYIKFDGIIFKIFFQYCINIFDFLDKDIFLTVSFVY